MQGQSVELWSEGTHEVVGVAEAGATQQKNESVEEGEEEASEPAK